MPNPRRKNEPTEAFIARCMDEIRDEYPDNSQRYAVCKSYSEKSSEKMKKQDLYVVVPRKAENRGKYLSRCSAHPKMKEQFGDLKERLGYCLTSFNEYYKYWAKLEQFAKVPEDTALGACIIKMPMHIVLAKLWYNLKAVPTLLLCLMTTCWLNRY